MIYAAILFDLKKKYAYLQKLLCLLLWNKLKYKKCDRQAILELQAPEMVFVPSLEFGVPDGFYDLVDGLVGDIYKQASLIKRLAAHSGQVWQMHF